MFNSRTQEIKDFLIKNRILTAAEVDCYLALVEGGKMNSHQVFRFLKDSGVDHGSRQKIADSMRTLMTKGFLLQEEKRITARRTEHIFTPKKLEDAIKPVIEFVNKKKHQQFDELFDRLQERETTDEFLIHSNQGKTIKKIMADINIAKTSVYIACGDCTWFENDAAKSVLKNAIKRKVKIKIYLSDRTQKDVISWLKQQNIEVFKNDSLPLLCIIDDTIMYQGYHDTNGNYHTLKIPKVGLVSDFKRHFESMEVDKNERT